MGLRLPASKANIWAKARGCAGWGGGLMSQPHRNKSRDTKESTEGDAAHAVGENCLNNPGLDPREFIDNEILPGVIVTREMARNVKRYVDEVRARWECLEQRGVEEPIHYSEWTGGKVDSWAYCPTTRTLFVWDYKNGHATVEVEGNLTLVIYVIGLINKFKFDVETVHMCIIQPNVSHINGAVRYWSTNMEHIHYVDEHEVKPGTLHATTVNPYTQAGAHCLSCEARHTCVTAQKSAGIAMDYIGDCTVNNLSPEALALELTLLKRAEDAVKMRRTGIESEVETLLRGGTGVPGYVLESTRGNLTWTISPEEVAAKGDILGINVRKPLAVLTPTQAKAEGFNTVLLEAITKRPQKGHKVKKVDHSEAVKIFSQ